MESHGGRAGAQPNSSDGSDQTRDNRAICHAGLDRGSQCSLCHRDVIFFAETLQNICELQRKKLKLAALTISGEVRPDDHSHLEVRHFLPYVTCARLTLT